MPRTRLFYHLVWGTRGRMPLITAEIEEAVYRHLQEAARRNRILVHAIGGMADHVHMAVAIPPTLAVSDAMKAIKGASAHAINQLGGASFGWQPEYGAITFAERHLAQVVSYIQNQKRHHADRTLWSTLEDL